MFDDKFGNRIPANNMELWGGVECTVNRVGSEYFDQLQRTGHCTRPSDFERFAALGIKALRQSILWERVAPSDLSAADWSWSDVALAKIAHLKIRPIVGLIHHGSGPPHTNLVDSDFPQKLSKYAECVAKRYPWVEDYTPVNEPLTTARFSGLYGHWYPHKYDNLTFCGALLNQCRAVVLSMRAIRDVNPAARLIQTDDLGKIFSTPTLAYQAEFENERRWLSFDLLCGQVGKYHPMWSYLTWAGVQRNELEWFLDNPCPPNVIGINHYLSGERFLDEHVERYPEETHGGNGRHRYADVLAARVLVQGADGPARLLLDAWERYRVPVAITECHNGCTREEQMRWFLEVWQAALQAREKGADVKAIAAWSLLGAFDWDTLVKLNRGHYEPGVFDLRSREPRPTAIASLIQALAAGKCPDDPILKVPGWWRRSQRFEYGFSVNDSGEISIVNHATTERIIDKNVRPLLIWGNGTLGRAFARSCELRGIVYQISDGTELAVGGAHSVKRALDKWNPWGVINAAEYGRVEEAENDRMRCYQQNTVGPEILASECAGRHIQFLTFSSYLVFDGNSSRPYVETDPVSPLNCYGWSKVESEKRVAKKLPESLIIRSGMLFNPWGDHNFLTTALTSLADKQTVRAPVDLRISPTYIPDLVNAALDLLIDKESGIWHLANVGNVSLVEFAKKAALLANIQIKSLIPFESKDLPYHAKLPTNSVLSSKRGTLLPSLDDALARYINDWQPDGASQLAA